MIIELILGSSPELPPRVKTGSAILASLNRFQICSIIIRSRTDLAKTVSFETLVYLFSNSIIARQHYYCTFSNRSPTTSELDILNPQIFIQGRELSSGTSLNIRFQITHRKFSSVMAGVGDKLLLAHKQLPTGRFSVARRKESSASNGVSFYRLVADAIDLFLRQMNTLSTHSIARFVKDTHFEGWPIFKIPIYSTLLFFVQQAGELGEIMGTLGLRMKTGIVDQEVN